MYLKNKIKYIFFKNTLYVFLPVFLSFILIFFVAYRTQQESFREKFELQSEVNTVQAFARYKTVMSEVNSQMQEITSSDEYSHFYYSDQLFEDSVSFRKAVKAFYKNTRNYIISSSYINNIGMYCYNEDFVIYGTGAELSVNAKKDIYKNLKLFAQNNKKTQNIYVDPIENYRPGIILMKKIIYNNDIVGIIFYSIDYNNFLDRIIMNDANTVALEIEDINIGEIKFKISEPPHRLNITTCEINENGLKFKCSYNATEYLGIRNIFSLQLWLIIFVCFIILVLITFFVSVKIYVPFKKINQIIDNPNSFGEKNENKEYDFILKKVESAVGAKFLLENRLAENLESLKKMEMIALQNQINPHFLYNTLQIISAYSVTLTEEDNKVTEMIENVAKMLKYAFSTKTLTTTVHDELEYLKIYCEFQKERFYEQFDVYYDIDEKLMNLEVVKLLFQPVIENAIYHSIRISDRKCKIVISGYIKNNCAFFDIINDGVPIKKEKADEINKYLFSGVINEDEHIGLSNINKRIKIIFGDEYGVKIFQNEISETVTQIKLPY